jgi:hypothetical protein
MIYTTCRPAPGYTPPPRQPAQEAACIPDESLPEAISVLPALAPTPGRIWRERVERAEEQAAARER